MKKTTKNQPTLNEVLSQDKISKKVKGVGTLLHTPMGSYYKNHDADQIVMLRFIDLTHPDKATISICLPFDWHSEDVDHEEAKANADNFDIIIENGEYNFVSGKTIPVNGVSTDLQISVLPPLAPTAGTSHPAALFLSKNNKIKILGVDDTVKSRTLYELPDGRAKFVIETINAAFIERDFTMIGAVKQLVPGDFVVFADQDHVHLVNWRTMQVEEEFDIQLTPIVMNDKPK
ncbi:hypothetical protein [Pseudomonas sp. NUPR-001]|uniref:hypothetical protein n=1 Tax=Pseudomonas sp. NUPR-001 TaxID=3416058 RepID=UPI003F95D8A9